MTRADTELRRSRRTEKKAPSGRRVQLLEIAASLFATNGYSQTTVRDIADEAGILSGSLYHHFDSKEAMLDEILRDFLGRLHERFREIEASGVPPRQMLDELIMHSFSTIHDTPHAVALYQNESSVIGRQPGFEYVIETSKQIEAVWLRTLEAGQQSGDFRKDLVVSLIYRFIRDTVWAAVRWYRPGGRFKQETVAEQYLSVLHGGLLSD